MRSALIALPIVLVASLMSGSASTSSAGNSTEASAGKRAVVIMSGGGAVSPFTTPTEACKAGLAAGNTDTALREYLLAQGKQVFTAPASDTWGTVQEPAADSFGAFGDCPIVLPEHMTVVSSSDINASGEHLARFISYLNTEYGITEVDFVGHSNGGLYSRAAIRIMKQTGSPVTVKSLTMLGTPNDGAFPTRFAAGEIGIDACVGNAFCEAFNKSWLKYVKTGDKGLNAEDTYNFMRTNGWNAAQAGYLDGIPVVLLAGTFWSEPKGDPELWPYDGITSEYSALAESLGDEIIPHRACWSAPLTHSIFVSDVAKLDWQTALTWNTDALARVNQAIDESDNALSQPNRQGCPT